VPLQQREDVRKVIEGDIEWQSLPSDAGAVRQRRGAVRQVRRCCAQAAAQAARSGAALAAQRSASARKAICRARRSPFRMPFAAGYNFSSCPAHGIQ